jgi:molybdopterin molybdotransferase
MTARGTHTHPGEHAQDVEDLDVEEVLALVNAAGTGAAAESPPPPQDTPQTPGAPRTPESRHRATPWPEARAIAARAARSAGRRAPVSVSLDSALGLVLAAPLVALSALGRTRGRGACRARAAGAAERR